MIKEVLIVEGRSDVARIHASHIDADMITTDGFSLRPDTLRQIACAYEKRGIIILTDPDQAGERIRRFLSKRFPKAKHAFIPRKDAIANDDLGVEQASPEAIRLALSKTRCATFTPEDIFSMADIMAAGLNGSRCSGTPGGCGCCPENRIWQCQAVFAASEPLRCQPGRMVRCPAADRRGDRT